MVKTSRIQYIFLTRISPTKFSLKKIIVSGDRQETGRHHHGRKRKHSGEMADLTLRLGFDKNISICHSYFRQEDNNMKAAAIGDRIKSFRVYTHEEEEEERFLEVSTKLKLSF